MECRMNGRCMVCMCVVTLPAVHQDFSTHQWFQELHIAAFGHIKWERSSKRPRKTLKSTNIQRRPLNTQMWCGVFKQIQLGAQRWCSIMDASLHVIKRKRIRCRLSEEVLPGLSGHSWTSQDKYGAGEGMHFTPMPSTSSTVEKKQQLEKIIYYILYIIYYIIL